MNKITVKFIEQYPPYNKGEVATFFEREANRLIDRGFAVYEGGDEKRESQADRLKALRVAPMTRHIPGPENTREIGPDDTKTNLDNKDATTGKPGGKKGHSGSRRKSGNSKNSKKTI